MDWGVFFTGLVSVLMLALMLVISALDRKIAQRQEQAVMLSEAMMLAEPEMESATSPAICASEA